MKTTAFLSILMSFLLYSASVVADPIPIADYTASQNNISAEGNGLAALAEHQVDDHGVIHADIRIVSTTTGYKVALSFTSDDMISFALGDTSVSNSAGNQNNQMSSPQHKMAMMAKSASRVLDRMINMNGVKEAQTVALQHGEIILTSIAGR